MATLQWCWWLDDGDRLKMLMTESLCWRLFSLSWLFFCLKLTTNIFNRHQHPEVVTNTFRLQHCSHLWFMVFWDGENGISRCQHRCSKTNVWLSRNKVRLTISWTLLKSKKFPRIFVGNIFITMLIGFYELCKMLIWPL